MVMVTDMVTDTATATVAPSPMRSKSLTLKDRKSTTEPTMVMEVTDMEATDMVTVMVAPSPMTSRDRRATTAHTVVMAEATVDIILVMVDTATDTTTTKLNTNICLTLFLNCNSLSN